MTTMLKTNLDIPVTTTQDLIDYLARGAKPAERWGIGTEMEKLVVDAETGEAASYSRIEVLLQNLEQGGDWRAVREEGHLIALLGESSSITLEPGGQLELSGQFCPDLHCCHADFSRHIEQIVGQAQTLGLAFLGLGVQPFTPLERIEWLPKARYRVMGPYMLRTGDLGQAMMKQSAGLQVNLDYADEADCIDKLRLSIALAPLLYALFANSPVMAGRPTGFLTTRGEIWARTDPDRTGLLPQLFQPEAGLRPTSSMPSRCRCISSFAMAVSRHDRRTLPFRRHLAEDSPITGRRWPTGTCTSRPSFRGPAAACRSSPSGRQPAAPPDPGGGGAAQGDPLRPCRAGRDVVPVQASASGRARRALPPVVAPRPENPGRRPEPA
jgi:glutamate--cysteine ligase